MFHYQFLFSIFQAWSIACVVYQAIFQNLLNILFSIKLLICLQIILSKAFDKSGRRLTGLQFSLFNGSSFLYNGMTSACFNFCGKQFVIFKPLSYCFEETIRFDVKASFVSRPMSRLSGDITNQVMQQKHFDKRLFSSTDFHGLKITN